MSRIIVEFNTNNDEFRNDDETLEVVAVGNLLRKIAQQIDEKDPQTLVGNTVERYLRDTNGNTIGFYTIDED